MSFSDISDALLTEETAHFALLLLVLCCVAGCVGALGEERKSTD